MKTLINTLIAAVLINLSVMVAPQAFAGGHSSVHVSVGFGMGYHPYYSHYSHYPYWHGPSYHYWPGWYYSPVIVEPAPVIIERPVYVAPPPVVAAPVVLQRPAPVAYPTPAPVQVTPAPATVDEKFLEYVRNRKAELIKQAQIADKPGRIKAIVDLAGLTFDDTVRDTLRNIATKNTDPDLRREAVTALGKSKNPQVIPILEEVRVNDDNREIRQAADQAINDVKAGR